MIAAVPCAVVCNSAVGMRRPRQAPSSGGALLRARLPGARVPPPALPLQSWKPNRAAGPTSRTSASSDERGGSGGSQGGSTEEPIGKRLYRSASGAFDSAKKAVEDLDKEHELRQKAAELGSTASKKAKETYAQVEDDLKRTVREVDRKYEVRGRTEKTFKSIKESAQSVDQQYGIRRKLQNIVDDVKRGWPDFKRRAQKFLNSPLGQGAMFAAVLYGLVSGILFKVMAYMFLIFWALAIFGVPRRMAQRMQQQQQQQRQQQAGAGPGGPGRASSGGFYPGGASGGFSGYQQQQQQQQQQRGAAGGAGGNRQQQAPGAGGGEVIDVEWDSIEEKRK